MCSVYYSHAALIFEPVKTKKISCTYLSKYHTKLKSVHTISELWMLFKRNIMTKTFRWFSVFKKRQLKATYLLIPFTSFSGELFSSKLGTFFFYLYLHIPLCLSVLVFLVPFVSVLIFCIIS